MNGIVITLVLGAALSHALWNLLLKQTESRLMMMMSMHTVTGLLGLALIPFIGPVEEAAWPMLLMSTVVHGGYYVFLTFSYRNVELGQAYPILRGTGPIVVFLASLLFLNEPVSTLQLFAFFLIAGGILSLSLRSFRYFQQQPSTIFYALGTGVLIGIYSLIDGIGVRNSGNVLGYICWLFFLEMLMVQAYAFYSYRGETIPRLIKLGWSGVWAGLLAAYAYGSVLWAMESAPIMLVAALRETSVVMASVLGILILKESKDLLKVMAAVLVTLGVVLLKA